MALMDVRRPALRAARTWAWFALALHVPTASQTIFSAHRDAAQALPTTKAVRSGSLTPGRPIYRLGNAARPFDWSTAIGDFNADGEPDFAIADHSARRRAASSGYRIQFSVSGLKPDDVALESTHEAVAIGVSDVDHDNDLDIVVSAFLSHEVVGVWLNDGRGRFTSAQVRQFPAAIRPLQTLRRADPPGDPSTSGLSPRRADVGLPRAFVAALSVSPHPLGVTRRNILRSTVQSSASGPRAPPQHHADFLS